MDLAAELGYTFQHPNAFQRAVQALASTRAGAWLFSKSLRHLDNVIGRLTGGRHSAPGLLAALPVVDVTTTGRRSGLPRTTHLISMPIGDTLALLGTNFGQRSTPAWVLNLEADPHATVFYRGTVRAVVARAATDAERAEVLTTSRRIYGGYVKYDERITGRRVRVFVLEPA